MRYDLTKLPLKSLIRSGLSILILGYLGVVLLAWLGAETLIFQPPPSSYRDTDRILKLISGDGVKISAVHLPNPDARYTILYSHGNAEDIGHLLPMLEEIRKAGFSVFAYDYRGYGTSSGSPSEKSAYLDEEAAYDYLVKTLQIPADRIIALGRSLGGGPAVDLAQRRPLAGLILESSFVTAYRVMTRVPLVPGDKFRSLAKIKGVKCPVLIIHGRQDEVISFWHGERLFAEANGPKLSFWVDSAGHNDLFEASGDRYSRVLRDFVVLIEKSRGSGHE